jgi:hypothetical protein
MPRVRRLCRRFRAITVFRLPASTNWRRAPDPRLQGGVTQAVQRGQGGLLVDHGQQWTPAGVLVEIQRLRRANKSPRGHAVLNRLCVFACRLFSPSGA